MFFVIRFQIKNYFICKETSKCMFGCQRKHETRKLRSDHWKWNLAAPARPSSSLEKSHITEFLFLLADRKPVTYKYAHEDMCIKTQKTCPKHSAQNFPASKRSWKAAQFQNLLTLHEFFQVLYQFHKKLCPCIKIPRCLDCVCNDQIPRNMYGCHMHIPTHPTMNTAEAPLVLLKDTVP